MATNLKVMHFISRHQPTAEQEVLAEELGYSLHWAGDVDAFDADLVNLCINFSRKTNCEAIACVHPLIALEAIKQGLAVGIFENANRAPEGEKPQFYAKSLRIVMPT